MLNQENYLIIPSVPTPNGGLHLGHIGGPYLRADVIKRYLMLQGHRAFLLSGTDSYESYVTLKAEQVNRETSEIANDYHQRIALDLKTMQIAMDDFVNPLQTKWHTMYESWQRNILQLLIDKGAVKIHAEKIAWDSEHQKYLTGCWLVGDCPECGAGIRGYFCEICGSYFRPEEIKNSLTLETVEQKTLNNLFLQLPVNMIMSENSGLNNHIIHLLQRNLIKQNYLLRLTTQSDWGLTHGKVNKENSVLFNYGLMHAYFIMFGDIARKLSGETENAFAAQSTCKTIVTFGMDNAVPFLMSILGITAHLKQYKTFDYYVANHFYYLDGEKFSTSRGHAIWVSDCQNLSAIEIDILRLYLLSIDVNSHVGHFVSSTYRNFLNETMFWLNEYVFKPTQQLRINVNTVSLCADRWQKVTDLFAQQEIALHPSCFAPPFSDGGCQYLVAACSINQQKF